MMAYLRMGSRRRRRIWRHLIEIVECGGRALAEFYKQNDTCAGDYVDALHSEAGLLLNELGEAKREIGYTRPGPIPGRHDLHRAFGAALLQLSRVRQAIPLLPDDAREAIAAELTRLEDEIHGIARAYSALAASRGDGR